MFTNFNVSVSVNSIIQHFKVSHKTRLQFTLIYTHLNNFTITDCKNKVFLTGKIIYKNVFLK